MKFSALVLAALFTVSVHAEKQQERRANCELRMITNASGGEIFLSLFTHTKEECLNKSADDTKAQFIGEQGQVEAVRGGAGPRQ